MTGQGCANMHRWLTPVENMKRAPHCVTARVTDSFSGLGSAWYLLGSADPDEVGCRLRPGRPPQCGVCGKFDRIMVSVT
jgi:hypothetical protein